MKINNSKNKSLKGMYFVYIQALNPKRTKRVAIAINDFIKKY